jgi:dUTP pyrophosphatase
MSNLFRLRGFEPVKDIEHKVQMPVRSDSKSAGYDFFSKDEVVIVPNSQQVFWTDVKAYMQDDEVLMLYVRSSLGIKKGLVLANGTGVIDASYYSNPDNDGNIGICLKNTSDKPVTINYGDRIAQGIFTQYFVADNDMTLHDSRTGGIGSSGK